MTTDDKIDAAMEAVWALVRSGPNFDGRDKDVRAAIEAVAKAERERCAKLCEEWADYAPRYTVDLRNMATRLRSEDQRG